jgi:hypothetical protein
MLATPQAFLLSAIMAARFLASAFASGPALLLILPTSSGRRQSSIRDRGDPRSARTLRTVDHHFFFSAWAVYRVYSQILAYDSWHTCTRIDARVFWCRDVALRNPCGCGNHLLVFPKKKKRGGGGGGIIILGWFWGFLGGGGGGGGRTLLAIACICVFSRSGSTRASVWSSRFVPNSFEKVPNTGRPGRVFDRQGCLGTRIPHPDSAL